jgi:glycosyltransferase 2 family protein
MKKFNRTKLLKFLLRWGIAVVGIWWIVSQITFRDRVNLIQPNGTVASMALIHSVPEDSTTFPVESITTPVPRSALVSRPDRKTVELIQPDAPGGKLTVPLLGMHLDRTEPTNPHADALIVADPSGAGGIRVTPEQIVGGFKPRTPFPIVEPGLSSMIRNANPWLLVAAFAVFPVTIVITTLRWNLILNSQGIRLPLARVFVLNMVGTFYNSFLPGSTGGDFAKAYFASRQTPHKIRAAISVFVDRVIGLLALVVMGGSMAAYLWITSPAGSPTATTCRYVSLACAAIVSGTITGALVIGSSRVRRALGLNSLISRLPMQHHLDRVREAGRIYKRNWPSGIWWVFLTIPVHLTVVISALLAGKAFGLSIATGYYFVCVPVMVLSASLPISPQGAGVMEWIGFQLLSRQGALVSEVLALTLSIRIVQVFWNLTGGIFVMRGGFESPHGNLDDIADEDKAPAVLDTPSNDPASPLPDVRPTV